MSKKTTAKLSEAEQVAQFMEALDDPLTAEIREIRKIIKTADSNIKERIKWNALSYYYIQDIVTFGPRRKTDKVMLVFHHPSIVKIKSGLLEGNYKDRRLMYFSNMAEIEAAKEELTRIVRESVAEIVRTNVIAGAQNNEK